MVMQIKTGRIIPGVLVFGRIDTGSVLRTALSDKPRRPPHDGTGG